jgi:NADH:ubiquinone oxidoreductase subunit
MSFLIRALTWWNDSTLGTALHTRRRGVQVGSDSQGNTYYKDRTEDRRWVMYNGVIEASRIPPEWHAWLHGMTDAPPSVQPLPTKPWEKPHQPNMTGTEGAYHPPGSLDGGARTRAKATGDYEAWRP